MLVGRFWNLDETPGKQPYSATFCTTRRRVANETNGWIVDCIFYVEFKWYQSVFSALAPHIEGWTIIFPFSLSLDFLWYSPSYCVKHCKSMPDKQNRSSFFMWYIVFCIGLHAFVPLLKGNTILSLSYYWWLHCLHQTKNILDQRNLGTGLWQHPRMLLQRWDRYVDVFP